MKYFLSIPLIFAMLFSGCEDSSSADANATEANTIQSGDEAPKKLVPVLNLPGSDIRPFAYLKTVSLPKLMEKATATGQKLDLGPQAAMAPALVGIALGDPGLATFDQDAPMTAFLFDDFAGEPIFLLALKLKPESPVLKQAEALKLSVSEHDGWTLATNAPELYSQVENWSDLLAFAEQDPEGELETGLHFAPIQGQMPKIKASAEGVLAFAPLEDNAKADIRSILDIALGEFTSLNAMKASIALSEESLFLRYALSAKPNTALGKALSPSRFEGAVEAAKYVESGGWMTMVGRMDMDGFFTYWQHLSGKLGGRFQGELKDLLERFNEQSKGWTKLYDGSIAARYDVPTEPGSMSFVQVGGTKAKPEEFVAILTDYTNLFQEFFSKLDFFESLGMKYEFKVEPGEQVEGVATSKFLTNMTIDAPAGAPALTELPYNHMVLLYGVVGDKYVGATDQESLAKLIQAIQTGKTVKNSLAETLPLQVGESLRIQFDLIQYALFILRAMPALDEGHTKELIDDLEELDADPISGSATAGKARISSELNLPLSTIKALIQFTQRQATAEDMVPPKPDIQPESDLPSENHEEQ